MRKGLWSVSLAVSVAVTLFSVPLPAEGSVINVESARAGGANSDLSVCDGERLKKLWAEGDEFEDLWVLEDAYDGYWWNFYNTSHSEWPYMMVRLHLNGSFSNAQGLWRADHEGSGDIYLYHWDPAEEEMVYCDYMDCSGGVPDESSFYGIDDDEHWWNEDGDAYFIICHHASQGDWSQELDEFVINY